MKAVVCHQGDLDVVEMPVPVPGQGQILLDVARAGICGSDLHARVHADAGADVLAEAGYDGFMRANQKVVFGHEFSGRIAAYGPGCQRKLPLGTLVVAMPLAQSAKGVNPIGLSAAAPGAYAEQVIVQEALTFAVPNGLSEELAALTEPMAIGWHAVRRSEIAKGDVAIIIGCGPVGLAVIGMLAAAGVRTIVASDLAAGRRDLASACGATHVVDPRVDSPYVAAGDQGHAFSIGAGAEFGLKAMAKLRRQPLPWQLVFRVAEKVMGGPKRPVVFECVGVPGMIDSVITSAPLQSRVVVAGVCMVPDTLRPAMAINKQIDLRFVVGYSPLEFRNTLHMIANGKVTASPLITGTVGLAGVAGAFGVLADPGTHAKVLIDPRSAASLT